MLASYATAAAGPDATWSRAAAATPAPRVCIIGGGFGGLYTAVRLESLLWPTGTKPQVTLIDQSDRFVFKPLLYELVNGSVTAEEVAPPFAQLLAPYSTTFVRGRVRGVEIEGKTQDGGSAGGGRVQLADGGTVEYDWLVMALGAETATFGIPGVRELALPFCTFSDAMRVNEALQALDRSPAGAPSAVVVVGGGYAGVELAASVAERMGSRARVKMVTADPKLLDSAPAGQRATAEKALRDAGISVVTRAMVSGIARVGASRTAAPLAAPNPPTGTSSGTASSAGSGTASTSGREDPLGRKTVSLAMPGDIKGALEADLVLWTAGSAPATKHDGGSGADRSAPSRFPFPRTARGATQTDPSLRVLRHARVFALGDVSAPAEGPAGGSGAAMPNTAQVAFQQADYVAWNLWASINGRPLLPFRYQHLGDMMSLGRANGAVTLPLPLPEQVSSQIGASPLGSLLDAVGISLGAPGARDGVTLSGPLAALARRAAYVYRQPTDEHRLRAGQSWLQRLAEDGALAAQKAMAGAGRNH